MNNRIRISLTTLVLVLFSCFGKAFAGNSYPADFQVRSQLLSKTPYLKIFSQPLTSSQRSSLEFLYAYMSLPDLTDYSGEFYLQNVDVALQAKAAMPWGAWVTDDMWRHFVLPPRVNNEGLDLFRVVYYPELSQRVKNMTMSRAALEINHWCHEHVTYKPADIRTSAPMATLKTATGRCGEESTLLVAALRTVGIPARQVYTPRWAHTDDNHAWVEAWVDGSWHFMGACEPEPVLDLGWFNSPASRGMLMHTKVFGNYTGQEEVMKRTNCYTEINVTSNYAPVRPIKIYVKNENGKAVAGAKVEYKLYNYAEYFTVATKQTDGKGVSSISAGLGDMVIWASKNGQYAFGKYDNKKDTALVLTLGKTPVDYETNFTLVPPVTRNNLPAVTPEQRRENNARLAVEDSIRNAYTSGFPDRATAEKICRDNNWDEVTMLPLIEKSKGNWQLIVNAAEKYKTQFVHLCRVLQTLNDKDLRDITMENVDDAMQHLCPYLSSVEDFQNIACPRVAEENLTPYRTFFGQVITKKDSHRFIQSPESLEQWVTKNIEVDNSWNPQSLCMSPRSVWNYRKTDTHSRDIFFVAMARSLGIAARIDEVTGKVQYKTAKEDWHDATFGAGAGRGKVGAMQASYQQTGRLDDPQYYSHFTLSKMVNGSPILLNYTYGDTWSRLFAKGTSLDAGQYIMVTGTRMADGSVLSHATIFNVKDADTTFTKLVMLEDKNGVQVIGGLNSEDLYFDVVKNEKRSILSTTGRGYYAIALVSPNHEPTTHMLNDMSAVKKDLEEWGRPILLLFASEDDLKRFKIQEFPNLPRTVVLGVDADGRIADELVEGKLMQGGERPVLLIADTFNRVVFASQGYNIGLGEQLIKTAKQLRQ